MSYKAPEGGAKFGLGAQPVVQGLEAASQSYTAGAPLKWVAGLLTECTNAGDIATQIAASLFAGIASAPASGVANTRQLFVPYETLTNSVMTVFTTEITALAQTNVGAEVDLAKDGTTGFWYVDKTASASDNVKIMALVDAVGETDFGKVEVLFL